MKKLFEFFFKDGGSIWVEGDELSAQEGIVPAGVHSDKLVSGVTPNFETMMEEVKPLADAIISKLQDLSTPPNQVHVEFGIKLNAQAGIILAAAGGEAHIKVGLSWMKD